MARLIEIARSLVNKACRKLDRENVDSSLSAMAKWWADKEAVRVVDETLQFHAGYGYIDDYPIEHFYREAKILKPYADTNDIWKMPIGRRTLDLV